MTIKTKTIASEFEQQKRREFYKLFESSPIPADEQLSNLGLYVKRQDITKQLFFNEIYKSILDVQGVIMEFGVRWGQNLVLLNNLRGIYEPFNYSRRIIGFDTFEGFPTVDEKDGNHSVLQPGAFSVTKDYNLFLEKILNYHESECPVSHVKKNALIKGDASETLKDYLLRHPETIIAFAYFDFDIYEPTKKCLELIQPHLTKGSVIGFDELTDPHFPGETIALKETLGINNITLKRNRYSGIQSYCVIK